MFKNDCELVIVTHNLTISSSPLTVQPIIKLGSLSPNKWYGDRVSNQLKRCVAPGNVKVLLKMSNLEPLHARCIVEIYDYLKQQRELILNGFDKVGVIEAVKSANEVFTRIGNTFTGKQACCFFLIEGKH